MNKFLCIFCKHIVEENKIMSTAHRNHCNYCLWSKHVDNQKGDRKAECSGIMKPIGITLKKEGKDKYGKERRGEIMLIHECTICRKYNINRIAADDNNNKIMEVFNESLDLSEKEKNAICKNYINLLGPEDRDVIKIGLLGRQPK